MSKSTAEIRQIFLDFFRSKGHQIVESSSLVPEKDPTLLFTNAGMNQFKDVFLGLDNRAYQCAATSQRCVRAGGKHNDLEKVGYTNRHLTFFEMLGNFSFGNYFKYHTIQWAWELLTNPKWFNIPKEKLWVTVYFTDDEAYKIWANEIGVPVDHIISIGNNKGSDYTSDNFWQMGETGPCGPSSEIFYDHGNHVVGSLPGSLEANGDRYTEIWNLVFMQFNRQADGTLLPLPNPSVDTGMGLERIAGVLQHVHSNYDIDIFKSLISAAAEITKTTDLNSKSLRVIADHIRSCAFLISDGVLPSNEGRGYVLRRIIRRAIRHGNMLGTSNLFFYKLISPLISVMDSSTIGNLKFQQSVVEKVLKEEEEHFSRTLKRGLVLLNEEIAKLNGDTLEGKIAFRLYDTYGLPLDITADVCREHQIHVDKNGFNDAMTAQRRRARESSRFNLHHSGLPCLVQSTQFFGYENLEHRGRINALFSNGQPIEVIKKGEDSVVVLDETSFYGESGGQVGDQGILQTNIGIFEVTDTQKYGHIIYHLGKLSYGTLKLGMQVTACVDKSHRDCIRLNHSATHLLYAALRQVLNECTIVQKGSLITADYLRFDFTYTRPMQKKQIRQIENIVNQQIRFNHPIFTTTMSLETAQKRGLITLFNNRYENKEVRVLNIGDFSTEMCNGIHADRTGDIGLFRIISESGIAAGMRRIEALTGTRALALSYQHSDLLHIISQLVKVDNQHLIEKLKNMQEYTRTLEKKNKQLEKKQAVQEKELLSRKIRNINGVKVLVSNLEYTESKKLRTMVYDLKNQLKSAIIVLSTIESGKVIFIIGVTKDLTDRIKADELISAVAQQIRGRGGGRPDLAQAGGNDVTALPRALSSVDHILSLTLL